LLRRPSNARLKTYQTSIGFFDLAIAAASMKAAAEAWGSDTDIFRKESWFLAATLQAAPATIAVHCSKRPGGSVRKVSGLVSV
jgi:hypothetical protein